MRKFVIGGSDGELAALMTQSFNPYPATGSICRIHVPDVDNILSQATFVVCQMRTK